MKFSESTPGYWFNTSDDIIIFKINDECPLALEKGIVSCAVDENGNIFYVPPESEVSLKKDEDLDEKNEPSLYNIENNMNKFNNKLEPLRLRVSKQEEFCHKEHFFKQQKDKVWYLRETACPIICHCSKCRTK